MAFYQAGQTLVWRIEVRDEAGALADPGTGPSAVITLPDGTTDAATVVAVATGVFDVLIASDLPGRYAMTAMAGGDNSGGFPYSDVADVAPADPRLICSLADVRAAMNTPAASRVSDEEVRGYIAAATLVVEDIVGPVLSATRTEVHDGGVGAILLYDYPTAGITSVTEDGVTLSASDYCLGTGGILYRGSRPGSGRWSLGARNVTVVYPVGASALDPTVRLAAAELVAHLYKSQRPNRNITTDMDGADTFTVLGYAVPNRVRDLLLPARAAKVPGFA